MSNSTTIMHLAEELRIIADEISYQVVDSEDGFYPRGTIIKAIEVQNRFKPKSLWVSLGNGKYMHLNGKKNLVTTHERIDGYTEVLFEA
jgi:hypothetical protein